MREVDTGNKAKIAGTIILLVFVGAFVFWGLAAVAEFLNVDPDGLLSMGVLGIGIVITGAVVSVITGNR